MLDIADAYTWGKAHLELAADDYHQRTLHWFHSASSAEVSAAEPDWSFVLESDPKLLGLALSVPLLALLLLVSLRIELHTGLHKRLFSLKAQAATAAWSARRSEDLGALHRGARYLGATVMRAGPVPRHVAFIMDGNRRWAKTNGLKTHSGHTAGYEAMCAVLEHCKDLGVEVVTVYAFSIENFKRDPAEVNYLMDLAMRKFEDAVSETGDLFKHRVRVRILGNLNLLPETVRKASARITFATEKNTGPICNICFSYTSRCAILTYLT